MWHILRSWGCIWTSVWDKKDTLWQCIIILNPRVAKRNQVAFKILMKYYLLCVCFAKLFTCCHVGTRTVGSMRTEFSLACLSCSSQSSETSRIQCEGPSLEMSWFKQLFGSLSLRCNKHYVLQGKTENSKSAVGEYRRNCNKDIQCK